MSQCQHSVPQLSYFAFVDESERRWRKGEKQGCCTHCGKWFWRDAFHTHTDFMEALDWGDTLQTEIKRQERAERRARRR